MRRILIHNGEGGGGDDIFDTQYLTDGLDEGRLSGTHMTVKSEYMLVVHRVDELSRSLADML